MPRRLFISVSPGEAWAALEEDGRIAELRIARENGPARFGTLHLGRIVGFDPHLKAALVDVGAERPAFLDGTDTAPGKRLAGLHEGASVVVQVVREARADKAAGVSLKPRLEGAWLDLAPGRPGIVFTGPRLEPAARQRLTALVERLMRPDEGWELRAAAADAADAALAADVEVLRARWQAIAAAARRQRPPAAIEPAPAPALVLIEEFLRPPPDAIVIDDRAALAAARGWLAQHRPELASRLALDAGPVPLIDSPEIGAAIETALARRVALPGGGALNIETTAAAVMIDVDSAGGAPVEANLDAAREAMRQVRLRNLAGPIVIDFIAMRRGRERVESTLLAAIAAMPPPAPRLLGWTRLGHMELVRERRRAALEEVLYEPGPDRGRVETVLTVALGALRALARAAAAEPARGFVLKLAPEVAQCLAEGAASAARRAFEARHGRAVALAAEPGRPRAGFDIVPA